MGNYYIFGAGNIGKKIYGVLNEGTTYEKLLRF